MGNPNQGGVGVILQKLGNPPTLSITPLRITEHPASFAAYAHLKVRYLVEANGRAEHLTVYFLKRTGLAINDVYNE